MSSIIVCSSIVCILVTCLGCRPRSRSAVYLIDIVCLVIWLLFCYVIILWRMKAFDILYMGFSDVSRATKFKVPRARD